MCRQGIVLRLFLLCFTRLVAKAHTKSLRVQVCISVRTQTFLDESPMMETWLCKLAHLGSLWVHLGAPVHPEGSLWASTEREGGSQREAPNHAHRHGGATEPTGAPQSAHVGESVESL